MNTEVNIGEKVIGKSPCYIIAEIGSNHDKLKSRAFEMINRAARAGADAVKFQLFNADRIAANVNLPEVQLNDSFSKFGKTVHDLYKNIELPISWLKELKACADENDLHFLATPFDETAADLLAEIGVPAMKVASFEITHIPFLRHIGKLGIPVLLSTGMASLGEIETAIDNINLTGENRIALFHCGIEYPALYSTVHLNCMETLRLAFRCPVGYSDHTKGCTVPIAAVALGASIYEKHVTLPGGKSPDHDFALDMEEFEKMVQHMRDCEKALGTSSKMVRDSEKIHLLRGRRSLFVVQDIEKGEVFTRKNLAILRPGIGIAPAQFENVLGKRAKKNLEANTLLKSGDW